mmetsp:Transcript_18656/g.55743  ORF Transcript_18656/g.55743 Transcript_18656/m.55743 type:complete len:204 (+) Transcript_18656:796-1407(+)
MLDVPHWRFRDLVALHLAMRVCPIELARSVRVAWRAKGPRREALVRLPAANLARAAARPGGGAGREIVSATVKLRHGASLKRQATFELHPRDASSPDVHDAPRPGLAAIPRGAPEEIAVDLVPFRWEDRLRACQLARRLHQQQRLGAVGVAWEARGDRRSTEIRVLTPNLAVVVRPDPRTIADVELAGVERRRHGARHQRQAT